LGFTREDGFVHPQVLYLAQGEVRRRYLVPRLQEHRIAGHEILPAYFAELAVAQHHSTQREHLADRLQRLFQSKRKWS
jgi:hypothetical protein